MAMVHALIYQRTSQTNKQHSHTQISFHAFGTMQRSANVKRERIRAQELICDDYGNTRVADAAAAVAVARGRRWKRYLQFDLWPLDGATAAPQSSANTRPKRT